MKTRFLFFFLVSFLFTSISNAAPTTPTGLSVSASETTITARWTANSDDTDGYYIYWGTDSGDLDSRASITDPDTQVYTISGLSQDTVYYVAISAYQGSLESDQSTTISIRTQEENAAPSDPEGFSVTDISDVTMSSISVRWDKNTETDLSYYKIYYGTSSGYYSSIIKTDGKDVNSYTISGLNASTRYYLTISAVDTSLYESGFADEIVVDTLDDLSAPNVPSDLSLVLSGQNDVRVTFDGNNDGMVDLAGYIIYYRSETESVMHGIDVGDDTDYIVTGLTDFTTYIFQVSAYDSAGNESAGSDSVSITIDRTRTLLSETGSFGSGCFIGTAGIPEKPRVQGWIWALFLCLAFGWGFFGAKISVRLFLAAALLFVFAGSVEAGQAKPAPELKNAVGIKIGFFEPSDDVQKEMYPDNPFPFFLTYERSILKYLSADVEIGYLHKDGNAVTVSGDSTSLDTRLTLVPMSLCLNGNFPITPLVQVFAGGGIDYWYYRETASGMEYDARDDDYGVGGWRLKTGLKLLTGDKEHYRRIGVVIEAVYTKIDRFGKNGTDLGGWFFNLGGFYCF